MRCFVAIELPESVRAPLERFIAARRGAGRSDVRWCSRPQLHITLWFFGEVGDAAVAGLCDALRGVSAAVVPFELRVGQVGAFPNGRRPRVLWAGVEDPSRGCDAWLDAAQPRLEPLDFPREARVFTPHVTLARARDERGMLALRRVFEDRPELTAASFVVDQLVLFESVLRPGGAEYRVVATLPLGG